MRDIPVIMGSDDSTGASVGAGVGIVSTGTGVIVAGALVDCGA